MLEVMETKKLLMLRKNQLYKNYLSYLRIYGRGFAGISGESMSASFKSATWMQRLTKVVLGRGRKRRGRAEAENVDSQK